MFATDFHGIALERFGRFALDMGENSSLWLDDRISG